MGHYMTAHGLQQFFCRFYEELTDLRVKQAHLDVCVELGDPLFQA